LPTGPNVSRVRHADGIQVLKLSLAPLIRAPLDAMIAKVGVGGTATLAAMKVNAPLDLLSRP
jgi:hypothetical protein